MPLGGESKRRATQKGRSARRLAFAAAWFVSLGSASLAPRSAGEPPGAAARPDRPETRYEHPTGAQNAIGSQATRGPAAPPAGKPVQKRWKVVERGRASWYGPGFHGRTTASGEIFDQTKLTAAHRTLPLGSRARVTNLRNGATVEVEINDRGPYVEGRIVDLSRAAAGALRMVEAGIALVRVESLDRPVGAG